MPSLLLLQHAFHGALLPNEGRVERMPARGVTLHRNETSTCHISQFSLLQNE
jgi:hypothetical protein